MGAVLLEGATAFGLQVAATFLFEFEGFEEGLEVPLAEALTSLAGDDLEEEGGAVLQRLAEELQETSSSLVRNARFWMPGESYSL